MDPLIFSSHGDPIEAYVARPERIRRNGSPAVVLCHGFPDPGAGAVAAAISYPDLAERLAADVGVVAVAFAYRGCGQSGGNFSIGNWLQDVNRAVEVVGDLAEVTDTWLVGFGTGGALALCAAAADPTVAGVATLGAPSDFADWADDPQRLYEHAVSTGAITNKDFPADFDAWAAEISAVDATEAAPEVAPRPLLVVHGSLDTTVSPFDARILADAHGDAELRIIAGAEHRLRYDPRSISILLGWLTRVT